MSVIVVVVVVVTVFSGIDVQFHGESTSGIGLERKRRWRVRPDVPTQVVAMQVQLALLVRCNRERDLIALVGNERRSAAHQRAIGDGEVEVGGAGDAATAGREQQEERGE